MNIKVKRLFTVMSDRPLHRSMIKLWDENKSGIQTYHLIRTTKLIEHMHYTSYRWGCCRFKSEH